MQLIATVQATRRSCGLISGPTLECVSHFLNHRTMSTRIGSLLLTILARTFDWNADDLREQIGQISRASLLRERICGADECAVVTQESRPDSNQLRYSFR